MQPRGLKILEKLSIFAVTKIINKAAFAVFPSASAQPQNISGVSDELGADGVGLVPHPLPVAAGDARLRDQLQVQQLLSAAHRAGKAHWSPS